MFWGKWFQWPKWVASVFGLAMTSHVAFAAIPFTGLITSDFKSDSCIADPGGQDVGLPQAFPSGEISGFDIQSVCLSYDPASDIFYIGIQTFIDISNRPIIFGDADGDGNASQTSLTLQNLLGIDRSNLSAQEFFTMAVDMNADSAPDLVVGTHNENSLSEFAARDGVSAPDNHLLLAPLARFYGGPLAGVAASTTFFPDQDRPHLEFFISGFSLVSEFSAIDLSDPDSYAQFYITTGSFDDDGISEEYFPNIAAYRRLKSEAFLDSDGDTINNLFDTDNDNDGLSDLVEKKLDVFDADNNSRLSETEALASGLDLDADGDIDIKDVGAWPDTDSDGTPDFLDIDSDNDGILDKEDNNPTTPGSVSSGGGDDDSDSGTKPVVLFTTSPSGGSTTSDSRLGGDVDLTKGAVRIQGQGCSFIGGISSSFGMMFWWIFLILWFGIVPKAQALRADHYQNSMDGLGVLNQESTQILPPKKMALGLSTHLMHNPLGFGLTTTGQSLDSLVNVFWVWNLWGATSFLEKGEIGLQIPFSIWSQIEDLTSTVERNTTSLGDVRLLGKWQLLESLAVIPFLELPTGNGGDFFGEANVTGGVKIVGEETLGHHEVSAHLGFFGRGKETVQASGIDLLEVGPEMLWGLGWRWLFSTQKDWALLSSLWGKSDFASDVTSPAELDFGLQKNFQENSLAATLGIGFGMNKGYGVPTYRVIFGVSHRPNSN